MTIGLILDPPRYVGEMQNCSFFQHLLLLVFVEVFCPCLWFPSIRFANLFVESAKLGELWKKGWWPNRPPPKNNNPSPRKNDVEPIFFVSLNLIPLLLHVWGLWFIGTKNGGKSLKGINPSCAFFSKFKIFKGGPDRGRSRTFSLAKGP